MRVFAIALFLALSLFAKSRGYVEIKDSYLIINGSIIPYSKIEILTQNSIILSSKKVFGINSNTRAQLAQKFIKYLESK